MLRKWTSHYVNLITCGAYISLLLAGLFLLEAPFGSEFWRGIAGLALILAVFAFAFNYWRYLAIAKTPTSTIAAAAQGYIELNGAASSAKPMRSPLHSEPCVWFRSWTYARDGGKNFWRLLDYSQSDEIFLLDDNTGVCRVNPKGAEVIHMLRKTSYQHGHRYVEEYLPANKSLYLIGHLDTRHHFNDPATINKAIGELLTDWKARPTDLLFRFDLDRNGKIDADEWERARAEARHEVEMQRMNQAHLGNFEISKPKNGQLYILSGMSPQVLRAGYRCWVMTHLSVLVILLGAISIVEVFSAQWLW